MRKLRSQAVQLTMASLLGVAPLLWFQTAVAASLSSRSVRIGSSLPGATTTHRFSFTYPGFSNVGSLSFEYCSNSPFFEDSCTAPAGLSLSGATLESQSGETGFAIDSANSTANKLILTRPPVATSAIPSAYVFANAINQSAPASTVYVRVATYASSDASGPRTDEGAVAYSTAGPLSVKGFVPPYITFCTGVTVALNCTSTKGSFLSFGDLSSQQARAVSSQFSVATNDPGGYNTFVSGPTMTSGNNTIAALGSPTPSFPGTSQFGMNLRANSNPAIGAEPKGVGSGAIAAAYSQPNRFFFKEQVMASSSKSTDFNAFTVSYVVNVNGNQPPGVYNTTLTYTAVAAF